MNIKNTVIRVSLACAFGFGTFACDDAKKDDKKDDAKKDDKKDDAKKDDKKAEEKAEPEPEPEPAPAAVEVSDEMKGFLAKFDGKSAGVEAGLKEFGANEEIQGNDMGMYDLVEPTVIAAEGDCFTMEAKAGMTVRTYNVCWAEGKISKIEDKGMR